MSKSILKSTLANQEIYSLTFKNLENHFSNPTTINSGC